MLTSATHADPQQFHQQRSWLPCSLPRRTTTIILLLLSTGCTRLISTAVEPPCHALAKTFGDPSSVISALNPGNPVKIPSVVCRPSSVSPLAPRARDPACGIGLPLRLPPRFSEWELFDRIYPALRGTGTILPRVARMLVKLTFRFSMANRGLAQRAQRGNRGLNTRPDPHRASPYSAPPIAGVADTDLSPSEIRPNTVSTDFCLGAYSTFSSCSPLRPWRPLRENSALSLLQNSSTSVAIRSVAVSSSCGGPEIPPTARSSRRAAHTPPRP